MKHAKYYAIVATALLGLCSCAQKGWKIDGTATDVAGKTVYLQASDNNVWSTIDSVTVSDNGSFAFTGERPAYPEIYRLNTDGQTLYLPIDSIDNITVNWSLSSPEKTVISGSASADAMHRINLLVDAAVSTAGQTSIAANDSLKRQIAELIQPDWSSLAAYYAINKRIGQTPLFDATLAFDRRIINAVANGYASQRPDDPRTLLLKNQAIELLRANSAGTRILAEEVPFVDISLADTDGNVRTLSDIWADGKTILLNFTSLTSPEAALFNIELNKVYEQYKDNGLEIYQVSVDNDEFAWAKAARNLPWVTVFAPAATAAQTLLNYNVGGLPTSFVINTAGDRMERIESAADLMPAVRRLL